MSNLSYKQFTERFKSVSTERLKSGLISSVLQDSWDRRLVIAVEYEKISKETRDALLKEFLATYCPRHCLPLKFFTGKKSDAQERNLILVFEHCKTLSDYLLDKNKDQVRTLTTKEIVYVFRKVVRGLYHIHSKGLYHGDIRESTVFIDEENRVKINKFPQMPTNVEVVKRHLKNGDAELAASVLLPPELAGVAIQQGEDNHESLNTLQMQKGDMFSLGLLIMRLINAPLFFTAVSNDGKQIDHDKLNTALEALSPIISPSFASIISDCLSQDPSKRPEPNENAWAEQEEEIKDESDASLRDWEMQVKKKEMDPSEKGFESVPDGLEGGFQTNPMTALKCAQSADKYSPGSIEKRSLYEYENKIEEPFRTAPREQVTYPQNYLSKFTISTYQREVPAFNNRQEMLGGREQPTITPFSQKPESKLGESSSPLGKQFGDLNPFVISPERLVIGGTVLDKFRYKTPQPQRISPENIPEETPASPFTKPFGQNTPKKTDIGKPVSHMSSDQFFMNFRLRDVENENPSKKQPLSANPQHTQNPIEKNTLSTLKLQCLSQLNMNLFDRLPYISTMSRSIGETYYSLKLLPPQSSPFSQAASKTVGFVHYPNGDLYFGFINNLAKDDCGLLFTGKGEVFHGEFRRGKINGEGVYYYNNGDVYHGEWKDEALHGTGVLHTKGKAIVCKFIDGELIDKAEETDIMDYPTRSQVGLAEFYRNYYEKTNIVHQLAMDYIHASGRPNDNCFGAPKEADYQNIQRNVISPAPVVRDYTPTRAPPVRNVQLREAELSRFNKQENKNRDFYKDYYKQVLEVDRAKSTQKERQHWKQDTPEDPGTPGRLFSNLNNIYSKLKRIDEVKYSEMVPEESYSKIYEDFGAPKSKHPKYDFTETIKRHSKMPTLSPPPERRSPSNHFEIKVTRPKSVLKPPTRLIHNENSELYEYTPSKQNSNHRNYRRETSKKQDLSNQLLQNEIEREGQRLRNILDGLSSDDDGEYDGSEVPQYNFGDKLRSSGVPKSTSPEVPYPVLRRLIRINGERSAYSDGLLEDDAEQRNEVRDPLYTGFAQVFFKHNERFYGNFVDGLAEGKGVYYGNEGWMVHGKWSRGYFKETTDPNTRSGFKY